MILLAEKLQEINVAIKLNVNAFVEELQEIRKENETIIRMLRKNYMEDRREFSMR